MGVAVGGNGVFVAGTAVSVAVASNVGVSVGVTGSGGV